MTLSIMIIVHSIENVMATAKMLLARPVGRIACQPGGAILAFTYYGGE